MVLIDGFHAGDRPPTERLVLPFETRCRSRLRARLASGEETGLMLARGTVLRGGDRLETRDGRVVEIVAAPETLMEARSADPGRLALAAYHLGNRHVPLQIGRGWVRFAADHVLRDMLSGLGFEVSVVTTAFEPEGGAYGPAHRHAHAYVDREYAPRIHDWAADGGGKGASVADRAQATSA